MWYSKKLLANALRPGTVILNQSGGEIGSIELKSGVYRVRCVGSGGYGGGRNSSLSYAGGGGDSGALLVIDVYLPKGTYFYYGANSVSGSGEFMSDGAWLSPQQTFDGQTCICHAGGGEKPGNTGGGGVGGSDFVVNNIYGYVNIISQVNGNSGAKGTFNPSHGGEGGASVDVDGISGKGGNGTNQSGTSQGDPGNSGRIEIVYLGSNVQQ